MANLQITFTGSDETKAAVDQVAGGLTGVGEAADNASSKGGGFFSNLLSTASGFLAANVIGAISGQITSFASDSFAAARDTAQLMAQTEQVIATTGGAAGMTAQQVSDLATALSDAAGKSPFGDDQIQGAENVLLKYRELKGIVPDVTKLAVDMAARLKTDPSAAAETLGRALQAPFDAEAKLAKQGIILDDQQKAMLATFKANGDAAGAQRFLMEELNKTYGGSAEAAAKAAGPITQIKARLGEMGEGLATAVLPAIDGFAQVLLDNVVPAVEDLANQAVPALTAAWQSIKPVVDALLPVLKEGLGVQLQLSGGYFRTLGTIVSSVMGAIGTVVRTVLVQVSAFWHAHGAEITAFLQQTWTRIQVIIKLAMDLINATIVPALQFIATFINNHGTEIQAIISTTWTIIKNTIDIAITLITGILTVAMDLISGNWKQAWDDLRQMCETVVLDIYNILKAEFEVIRLLFVQVWDGIKAYFQGIMDSIVGWVIQTFQGIENAIISSAGALRSAAGGVADGIVSGITSGIADGASAIINAAKDAAMSALHAAEAALGIGSPSEAFRKRVGHNSAEGLILGLRDKISEVTAAGADMAGAALTPVGGSRGGARGGAAAAGVAGATNVVISIDDRGLSWLKQLIKVEVQQQTAISGRNADARQRTR